MYICFLQVEKVYTSPTGEEFESWSAVKDYCEAEGIPIKAAQDVPDSDEEEQDFGLPDMLHWLHAVAASSPNKPSTGGGRLMRLAIARVRVCLTIDPGTSQTQRGL